MKKYIGDGVFVSDSCNPGHITVSTENGIRTIHEIHLEPNVVFDFLKFLAESCGWEIVITPSKEPKVLWLGK